MSTARGSELFLEAAGVVLGLGILAARLIDRRIGQAHHHAPDGSQDSRRPGFNILRSATVGEMSESKAYLYFSKWCFSLPTLWPGVGALLGLVLNWLTPAKI